MSEIFPLLEKNGIKVDENLPIELLPYIIMDKVVLRKIIATKEYRENMYDIYANGIYHYDGYKTLQTTCMGKCGMLIGRFVDGDLIDEIFDADDKMLHCTINYFIKNENNYKIYRIMDFENSKEISTYEINGQQYQRFEKELKKMMV